MANISTYATKATPVGADKTIGTDSADGTTKNFLFSALPAPDVLNFFDIGGGFTGKPAGSQTVLLGTVARAWNIAANFAGSYGACITNPTATATFTINKIVAGATTAIGTMVVSTGGVFTFTTTSGAVQSLAAGNTLQVVAPGTADSTLADASFVLTGKLY